MPKFSPLTARQTSPALLTSPIGQGSLTCKGCATTATRYVLGRGPRTARDAARVAGFNFVKGRGWLCLECEFGPVPAAIPVPAP